MNGVAFVKCIFYKCLRFDRPNIGNRPWVELEEEGLKVSRIRGKAIKGILLDSDCYCLLRIFALMFMWISL